MTSDFFYFLFCFGNVIMIENSNNYNIQNNPTIILMREQRWKESLRLELGELKETVSRRRNGRQGRGLQKNLKNVGARVHPLLPSWWLVVVGTRG